MGSPFGSFLPLSVLFSYENPFPRPHALNPVVMPTQQPSCFSNCAAPKPSYSSQSFPCQNSRFMNPFPKTQLQLNMLPSFSLFRKFTTVFWVLALTLGGLHAAPYGPNGLETEWTQPDGSKLSLRVFGDEFYARTETLDGDTVVFDPARNAYFCAEPPALCQSIFRPWVVPMCSLSIVLFQQNPIRK